MSQPFLIVGLPRTKGAWLSVAASLMNRAACYHEPTATMDSWQGVFDLWNRDRRHRWVGISDSLLSLHLGEIIEEITPRILIVNRPVCDVEKSIDRLGLGGATNYCEILLERLLPYRSHLLVSEVDYHELADIRVVRSCLFHLMPGLTIEDDKLREIMHINCQEDLDRVRRLAVRADYAPMFGKEALGQLRMKSASH